jgi:hypothetical protein
LYKLTSGISKLLKISILFAQKKGKSKVEEAFSFVTLQNSLSNLRIAPKSNSFEDCCSKISPIPTNQPILPYFCEHYIQFLGHAPSKITLNPNHSKPYDTQKQQIEYINFDKHMHDQT